MKKLVKLLLLIGVFSAFYAAPVLAATATINAAGAEKGIVTVTLADFSGKVIKAQVKKGEATYTYTLNKSPVNLPLQMGAGEYTVNVLENVAGDKYKPLTTQKVSVKAIDEKELYKASIPLIEYSVSTKAIPAYKTLTAAKKTEGEKVAAVYADVVKSISYDTAKAASVKGDYVPVIDTVYAAKKGICYDYAAVLGGALRSQGIPTKLVMGYVPEIKDYHAWNEVLIGGKWVAVDATYDSQVVKAGKSYTMEKDKAKTKVVKTY